MYWTPDCDPALKSRVGMLFNNLRDDMFFYDQIAPVCGFDSRKSSQQKARDDVIVWKYMVCNRQGFKNVSKSTTVAPNTDSCNNVDLANQLTSDNEDFTIENESCESDGCETEEQHDVEGLPNPGVCVNDEEKKRRRVSNRCGCRAHAVFRLADMNR
ncbi:unnamed protein product [Cuscuta europaea]|uniref:Uncharacterized protein n=1 Tax=Cuscuta europaea TaxID=41803 RepID=A0A9P0ZVG5_CUSEU|nr:unnamed protein product [Cuscuta europaea]